MKRAFSFIYICLILVSMFTSFTMSTILPVNANETVYIKSDGSIDPPTALIYTIDNVTYTLTGDINDFIVIERSNIIINGAGHAVLGPGIRGIGSGIGVHLSYVSNVTIKNVEIKAFGYGIVLTYSSNNSISGCCIATNSGYGIILAGSNYNLISENSITANNMYGISLGKSSYNRIIGNNITNNRLAGISLYESSNNSIYHNNFLNNKEAEAYTSTDNVWDNGYPSGGNYWSNYTGADLYAGPYQNETGSDGIGDTPYMIEENNVDRYPLITPWTPPTLELSITPSLIEVNVGEWAKFEVTIKNIGKETAYESIVELIFDNLAFGGPSYSSYFDFNPGDVKRLEFSLYCKKQGDFTIDVKATWRDYSGTYYESAIKNLQIIVRASNYILHVQSSPITEVSISYIGDFSGTGTTNFDIGPKSSPFTVTLTTPSTHENYKFSYWQLDGINIGESNSLTVEVNDKKRERTAVAVYSQEIGEADFSISVSPDTSSIAPSRSTSYTVTVTSINGFNFPVSLSGSVSPSTKDISLSFDPQTVTPPKDGSIKSTLTVLTTSSVTPGTYALTITGYNKEMSLIVGREIALIVKSQAFIAGIQWNRDPPAASLHSFDYSEGMAREHGIYIWWDDYYLEGLYAYVSIRNPTDSKFSGKIIWNLIGPDESSVCSETVPSGLLNFLEVESQESETIKLFIRDTRLVLFRSELKPGLYRLEVSLAERTGVLSYETIDKSTSNIRLLGDEPPLDYPMKDLDGDGLLEDIPGKAFYFFERPELTELEEAVALIDIIFSFLTLGKHKPIIAQAWLGTSPALQTAKICLVDKGLQDNVRSVEVLWWNTPYTPKPGIAYFFGARYDRAVVSLELPSWVDVVDDGGADFHLLINDRRYLIWYETKVDKRILSTELEPQQSYTIKIKPKPWSVVSRIQINASIALEFGPFEEIPTTDSLVYNYTKWQERPEEVYWGTVGIHSSKLDVDLPTLSFGTIVELQEFQHKLYLHVYDQQGRHVGLNYKSNQTEINIPGAYYNDTNCGMIIVLPENVSDFKIVIDAIYANQSTEACNLTISTVRNSRKVFERTIQFTIQKGTFKELYVRISGAGEIVVNEDSWLDRYKLWVLSGLVGGLLILTMVIVSFRRRKIHV